MDLTRREFGLAITPLIGLISGCQGISQPNESLSPIEGSLVFRNNDSLPHEIEVIVWKMEEASEAQSNAEPSDTGTRIASATVDLSPDERKTLEKVITEEGSYAIVGRMESQEVTIDYKHPTRVDGRGIAPGFKISTAGGLSQIDLGARVSQD